MAREPQTIEVHVLGKVTFQPLGKVQMERLQARARRSALSPAGIGTQATPTSNIEDSLLIHQCVLDPKFDTDDDFFAAVDGHKHVVLDIADAIRAVSWPNQPAG